MGVEDRYVGTAARKNTPAIPQFSKTKYSFYFFFLFFVLGGVMRGLARDPTQLRLKWP